MNSSRLPLIWILSVFALAAPIFWAPSHGAIPNAAADDTVTLVYRMKFLSTGGNTGGPYSAEIVPVVNGTEQPAVKSVHVAPGDQVEISVVSPGTKYELDKWNAKFNWAEEAGKKTIDHPTDCTTTFTGVVGEPGLQVIVAITGDDGKRMAVHSAQSSDKSHTMPIPHRAGAIDATMWITAGSRRVTDTDFRKDPKNGLDDKYKLVKGPTFNNVSTWYAPAIVEMTIKRKRP